MEKNAKITSILSEQENTFIKNLADSNEIARLYIGLQRTDSGLIWQDRSPVVYTNWAEGEGNDSPNPLTMSMVVGSMMASEGGTWADNEFTVQYPYVCKRPKVLPSDMAMSMDPIFGMPRIGK